MSMPGFGIAMRAGSDRGFAYACDALIGIPPSDVAPALAFTDGGNLLVGTAAGLRGVTADGCPRSDFGGELARARVVALAAHPRSPNIVYAVTQGMTSEIARSSDGGQTWEIRSTWPERDPVTALVLDDADPNVLYVSQDAPVNRSTVRVSNDGGATFASFAVDQALTLLHIEGPPAGSGLPRFWSVARSPSGVGNRGFDLLRAAAPEGPWTAVHQVNFFGGFAIDSNGAIWMGDEGGGVYRSMDGAATFENVAADTAVACLVFAQGALWGCTPGTPQDRALAQWDDVRNDFAGVVALGDIARMVECGPSVDVLETCALAWSEWQRDVLTPPPVSPPPEDGGAVRPSESSSSCAIVTGPHGTAGKAVVLAFAALSLRISRRLARARSGRSQANKW